MSKSYEFVKKATIDFAARFGFVTREIFFDYLCPMMRSRKFSYWRDLQVDGFIKPALSNVHICYLTKTGRKVSLRPVTPARSMFFIEHDSATAALYLELDRSGLVLRSWTDHELSRNPWDACTILGTDRMEKIPDLVIDMKSASGALRIAIETERSRKASVRYDEASLHYLRFKNVNLLLYACNSEATLGAVARAFAADAFRRAEKTPALFLLSDFKKSKLNAEARFMGHRLSLKKLILAASEQPESAWSKNVDEMWTAVHGNSAIKGKSA